MHRIRPGSAHTIDVRFQSRYGRLALGSGFVPPHPPDGRGLPDGAIERTRSTRSWTGQETVLSTEPRTGRLNPPIRPRTRVAWLWECECRADPSLDPCSLGAGKIDSPGRRKVGFPSTEHSRVGTMCTGIAGSMPAGINSSGVTKGPAQCDAYQRPCWVQSSASALLGRLPNR